MILYKYILGPVLGSRTITNTRKRTMPHASARHSPAPSSESNALPVGASISVEGAYSDDTPSSDGGASSGSHAGSDTDDGGRRPNSHKSRATSNEPKPRAGLHGARMKGVSSVSTDEHARALPRFQSISLDSVNNDHSFLSGSDSDSKSSKFGSSPDAGDASSSSDRSSSWRFDRDGAAVRSSSRPVTEATTGGSNSSDASHSSSSSHTSASADASSPVLASALPIVKSDLMEVSRRIKKNVKRKGRPHGTEGTSVGRTKGDSRSRCVHGRRRYTCVTCGGKGICEHKRQRYQCKECRGSGICPHDRIRSQCKDCKGGSICQHKRIRSVCVECGGGSICEHKRIRGKCAQCKDVVGGSEEGVLSGAALSGAAESSASSASGNSSSASSSGEAASSGRAASSMSRSKTSKQNTQATPSPRSNSSSQEAADVSPTKKGSGVLRAPAVAVRPAASKKARTKSETGKSANPARKQTRKSSAIKKPAKIAVPQFSPVTPHASMPPFKSPAQAVYMLTRATESYVRNNKAGGLKNVRCFPTCLDRGHNQHGFCGRSVDIRVTCDSERLAALCGLGERGLRSKAIVAYGHFALCTDENGKSLNALSVPPTKNSVVAADAAVVAADSSCASDSSPRAHDSGHSCKIIHVSATGSVRPDGHEVGRGAMFTIGKSYVESEVENLTKTHSDHSMPLYRSHVETSWTHEHSDTSLGSTASQTENDVISMEAAARSESADKNVRKKEPSVYQVLSFCPSSWHYGWRSSKHMRKSLHVFRVYVFAVTSTPSSSVSPASNHGLLKCIGSVETSRFTLASSKRSKSKKHTLKRISVKRKVKGAAAAGAAGARTGPKSAIARKSEMAAKKSKNAAVKSKQAAGKAKAAGDQAAGGGAKNSMRRSRAASEAASNLLSITSNHSMTSPRLSESLRMSDIRIASGYSGGDSRGYSGSGSGSNSASRGSSNSSGSSGSGTSSGSRTSSDSDGNSSNSNSDESASKARDGEISGWHRVENRKKAKKNGKKKSVSLKSQSPSSRGCRNAKVSSTSGSSRKRRPNRESSGNRKARKSAKTSADGSDVGAAVRGLLSMLG